MPERLARSSDPALCLEVWLGPIEGMRHVEPVPASKDAVVRIGRRRADEKRGLENQFVLAEGEGVSSFHAELRCSGGKLFLKDLKSTNGTFARNKPVTGEIPIESGEIFLLSTTPVRAELVVDPRTEVSATESPAEDPAVSSTLKKMLSLAREAARRRGEAFVDSRHLAEAVLRSGDAIVEKGFARAKLSREEALADLWRGGLFHGGTAWLQRFLSAPVQARTIPDSPALSPRARRVMSAAAIRLAAYPSTEAESLAPVFVLAALLAAGEGPVGGWLSENGVRAETPTPPRRSAGRKTVAAAVAPSKEGRLSRIDEETVVAPVARREKAAAEAARAEEEGAPATALLSKPASTAAHPTVPAFSTTGDSVLDQRARAIALELEETATLYRFSTPEDRRTVMKAVVNRSLAAIAPENRTRILSQIRVQFPVVGAPPPAEADEVPRLLQRIQELEQRLERLKAEKAEASSPERLPAGAVPWKALLAERPPEPPATEGADLPALHALLTFARHMERFLLGLVQGVTMPGDATMSFRLPGHRYTLEGLLSGLEQGKPVDPKTVSEYLRELERWQVAILAAHHESARLWFDKLWKRASPAAIEASTAKGGTWKIRGEATEWWSRYKETVKGLTPDVVQDQVLQTTFRLAQEEFDKLSKRRQS
ncbi:MAG TPA: FHA domain-containing protein [Thermoanaerobaculia bacterium]|nr:FHA domain-containing protein [Thermoanaerobaculia bacterium]